MPAGANGVTAGSSMRETTVDLWILPGEFPTQRPVTRSFDVFFDLRPNIRLGEAGDLRRHRAHCDVTVMHFSQDLDYELINSLWNGPQTPTKHNKAQHVCIINFPINMHTALLWFSEVSLWLICHIAVAQCDPGSNYCFIGTFIYFGRYCLTLYHSMTTSILFSRQEDCFEYLVFFLWMLLQVVE